MYDAPSAWSYLQGPLAWPSIKGMAIVVGLGLASASFACKTKKSGPGPSTRTLAIQSSTSNDAATTDAGKPALVDASWMERLELPGGRAAFVSVPLGTTTLRPIMVAAHGAGDRPEWACGAWRGITESRPFVVCPQGAPLGNGTFYWRSAEHFAETVELALAAYRHRFASDNGEDRALLGPKSEPIRCGALILLSRISTSRGLHLAPRTREPAARTK